MDKLSIHIRKQDFSIREENKVFSFFKEYRGGYKLSDYVSKEFKMECYMDQRGLLIQINPNRIINEHNLISIESEDQVKNVIDYVEDNLNFLGFDFDHFYASKLKRIDIDLFYLSIYGIHSLLKLLDFLKVKYRTFTSKYPTYKVIGNKSWSIKFYDPIKKYICDYNWTDDDFKENCIDPQLSIIKFETSFYKQAIKKHLEIETVADLLYPGLIKRLYCFNKDFLIDKFSLTCEQFDNNSENSSYDLVGLSKKVKEELKNDYPKIRKIIRNIEKTLIQTQFFNYSEEYKCYLESQGYKKSQMNELMKSCNYGLNLLAKFGYESDPADVYREFTEYLHGPLNINSHIDKPIKFKKVKPRRYSKFI